MEEIRDLSGCVRRSFRRLKGTTIPVSNGRRRMPRPLALTARKIGNRHVRHTTRRISLHSKAHRTSSHIPKDMPPPMAGHTSHIIQRGMPLPAFGAILEPHISRLARELLRRLRTQARLLLCHPRPAFLMVARPLVGKDTHIRIVRTRHNSSWTSRSRQLHSHTRFLHHRIQGSNLTILLPIRHLLHHRLRSLQDGLVSNLRVLSPFLHQTQVLATGLHPQH